MFWRPQNNFLPIKYRHVASYYFNRDAFSHSINRRRDKQIRYNEEHGITPRTVGKSREAIMEQTSVADYRGGTSKVYIEPEPTSSIAADPLVQYMSKPQLQQAIDKVRKDMNNAAKDMDFLQAAKLRDELFALEKTFAKLFGEQ